MVKNPLSSPHMMLSGLDWFRSFSASLSAVKKLDSALLSLSPHNMNPSWLAGFTSLFIGKELPPQVKDPVITVLLSISDAVVALQ